MPEQPIKMTNKIAVIEDDKILMNAIVRELEFENFDVVTAMNGEDGLILIKKENPDLIILDIVMPGMDGLEMLKKLRESMHLTTPVIVLTNLDSQLQKIKAMQYNIEDYFIKSNIRLESLLEKVKLTLERGENTSNVYESA